jgi:hypothetical protein
MGKGWGRGVALSAASIISGVALVLVAAVAAPASAAPSAADLVVTASPPVQGKVGKPYTHTFTATNQGDSPAAAVHLEIDLNGRGVGPGGTVLLSPPPLGCVTKTVDPFGSTELDCSLGTLAPGHSASRSITVSVTGPGVYWHGAWVSTSSPESDLGNNSAATSADIEATSSSGLLGFVTALLQILLTPLGL